MQEASRHPDRAVSARLEALERRIAETVEQRIRSLREQLDAQLRKSSEDLQQMVEAVSAELPSSFLTEEDLAPLADGSDTGTSSRLLDALERIDGAADQGEILAALLDGTQAFASRSAFLLTRAEDMIGWDGRGFDGQSEAVESLELPYAAGEAWSALSDGHETVVLDAKERTRFAALLDVPVAEHALLVSFVLQGRLAGAVYADRLASGHFDGAAVQVLARGAAHGLETLALRAAEASEATTTETAEDDLGAGSAAAAIAAAAAAVAAGASAVVDESPVEEIVDESPAEETAAEETPETSADAVEAHDAADDHDTLESSEPIEAAAEVDEAPLELEPEDEPLELEPLPESDDIDVASTFTLEAEPETVTVEDEPVEEAIDAAPEDVEETAEIPAAATEEALELAAEDDPVDEVEAAEAPPLFALDEESSEPETLELEVVSPAAVEDEDLWEERAEDVPTLEVSKPKYDAPGARATSEVETARIEPPVPAPPPAPANEVDHRTVKLDLDSILPAAREAAAPESGMDDTRPSAATPIEVPDFDLDDPRDRAKPPEAPTTIDPTDDATLIASRGTVSAPTAPDRSTMDATMAGAKPTDGPKSARSGNSEVRPPEDLVGPGTAFGGAAVAEVVPDGEEALHEEARRLARLLVSEIKLYNEEIIEEGRREGDIYARLREDIDRSRQMYEERVDDRVRAGGDYFHQELVLRLAGGDPDILGM